MGFNIPLIVKLNPLQCIKIITVPEILEVTGVQEDFLAILLIPAVAVQVVVEAAAAIKHSKISLSINYRRLFNHRRKGMDKTFSYTLKSTYSKPYHST